MAKELRFYSIVLIVLFILWSTPGNATSYNGCPTGILYGPVDSDSDWHDEIYLYQGPFSTAAVDLYDWHPELGGDFTECSVDMNAGTYYDGGNHKWVLNTDLDCAGNDDWSGETPYAIGMGAGNFEEY